MATLTWDWATWNWIVTYPDRFFKEQKMSEQDTKKILMDSIEAHQKAIDKAKQQLKDTEITYSRGDRFTEPNGEKCILAVDGIGLSLICLVDGNRWNSPVAVSDVFNVTQRELERMSTTSRFTRYWNSRRKIKS